MGARCPSASPWAGQTPECRVEDLLDVVAVPVEHRLDAQQVARVRVEQREHVAPVPVLHAEFALEIDAQVSWAQWSRRKAVSSEARAGLTCGRGRDRDA